MFTAQDSSQYGDLTVEQARAMRADQARLAALYADRVEQAQAAAERGVMAHWRHEYRRSASRCRLLGERIRTGASVEQVGAWRGAGSRLEPKAATVVRREDAQRSWNRGENDDAGLLG
jgi:hypothetical protein